MQNVTHEKRRSLVPKLLTLAALAVLIIGGLVSFRQWQSNKNADKVAAQQQNAANHGHATGDNPSTNKPSPSAFASWQVPADNPRYIFIPKIGVRAVVKPTGLTQKGAIGAPTNVYDTDWYTGSAKPGQPGATLIDGHLDGYNIPGIFWNLHKLTSGDQIKIEKGDGRVLTYKVVKSRSFDSKHVDMQSTLVPIIAGQPGLNLITCTGDIVPGTYHYGERLVVYATQV